MADVDTVGAIVLGSVIIAVVFCMAWYSNKNEERRHELKMKELSIKMYETES